MMSLVTQEVRKLVPITQDVTFRIGCSVLVSIITELILLSSCASFHRLTILCLCCGPVLAEY